MVLMTKLFLALSIYMEKIMTDKKQDESKTSEEKKSEQGFSTSISLTPTPEKSPSDEKQQSVTNKNKAPANEKKSTMKSPEKVSTPLPKKNSTTNKQKLSKTAVLSLIIALAASAGVGGLYYWGMQKQAGIKENVLKQTQQILANSEQKTQQNLASIEQKFKQLLDQQQAEFSNSFTKDIAKISADSQVKMTQLEKTVERLSQNQPSDWLLHEAEYLIRIATRTIWLQHDTSAAIGLLQDADMRLKELDDPSFLPIRQLIREDIAQLTLIPIINSEDTIMTLMAMSKQLTRLPLAMVKIPNDNNKTTDFTLSENINDWRENLAKTWQKILADFITIRRSSGDVKPLMSPQYQQNLSENLSLKLQLAQWAVTEKKQKIYNQTLTEVQQWLTEYFDMENVENQSFYQGIQQLKSEIISYDYPSTLLSLKAISKVLASKPLKPLLDPLAPQVMPNTLPDNQIEPIDATSKKSPEAIAPQESKVQPKSTSETI
jgi:uroporphyrin-3 C-methyltransferase